MCMKWSHSHTKDACGDLAVVGKLGWFSTDIVNLCQGWYTVTTFLLFQKRG